MMTCRNCGHDARLHRGAHVRVDGFPFSCGECSTCEENVRAVERGEWKLPPR